MTKFVAVFAFLILLVGAAWVLVTSLTTDAPTAGSIGGQLLESVEADKQKGFRIPPLATFTNKAGDLWDEVWHGGRGDWHECWNYVPWPDCKIHPGEVEYKLVFPPELGGYSQAYCQRGVRTIGGENGTWISAPLRTTVEFLDIRGLPHEVTLAEWADMKNRNLSCFRLKLHPDDVPYRDRFSVRVVTGFTGLSGRL